MPAPMAMSCTRTSPVRQPSGTKMLNSTTTNTVNAAWPTTKFTAPGVYRRGTRRSAGRSTTTVSSPPIVAITADATPEADQRTEQCLQRGRAGAERVRAQDRQRREDHPERVLDRGRLGHEHRERRARCRTRRVAEPDRTQVAVGAQDAPRRERARLGGRHVTATCRASASSASSAICAAASERRRSGKAAAKRSMTASIAPSVATQSPPTVRARRCARLAPAAIASTPSVSASPATSRALARRGRRQRRCASATYSGVGSASVDCSAVVSDRAARQAAGGDRPARPARAPG